MSALPTAAVRVVRRAAAAAAVLDPVRLRLLRELVEPASATELARRLGQPRQRVNYHLRDLERHGLVRLVAERKKGNCTERLLQAVARSYLVSPEALGALGADLSSVADRATSAHLVAVAGEAIREVGVLHDRVEQTSDAVPTFAVQTQIRFGSVAAMNAFAEEVAEQLARIAAKYRLSESGADGSESGGRLFTVFTGGYPSIMRDAGDDQRPDR